MDIPGLVGKQHSAAESLGNRTHLDLETLVADLIRPGSIWREVVLLPETPSTNAVAARAAAGGAPEGLIVTTDWQSAGRGRRDRTWVSPPMSGIAVSVLLRPTAVPAARWSWLPLLAGLAVASVLRDCAGADAELKWPNDVLLGNRKVAGILAERAGSAVVLGIGINVALSEDELPVPEATSLSIEGASVTDRHALLVALLTAIDREYRDWVAAGGDPDDPGHRLRPRYRLRCRTLRHAEIGQVSVSLPDGRRITGHAVDVDDAGRLLLEHADGSTTAIGAGDVLHVR